MSNLCQQIKKLESQVALLDEIRAAAKTDGGKLTTFGQNFVFVCATGNVTQSTVAKILDVSPSAISQQVSKMAPLSREPWRPGNTRTNAANGRKN